MSLSSTLRLAAGAFLAALLVACGSPAQPLQTGSPAPAFEARFVDGSLLRFPADLAGRPVVLDFWADWCRYCVDSMQRLEQARRAHAGSELAIVAINVGQDADTAAAFLRTLDVGYASVLDPQREISARYGVRELPVSFFIDREGRIAGRILGGVDERVLAAQLERILPAPALDPDQRPAGKFSR